ncbi:MAG: 4-alpha-glucanotransferase [Candidatus Sumerlaeia bacterium]|nr:4-alpha-glucanotransferase [Candidatus Sumerlaeia bacterium]
MQHSFLRRNAGVLLHPTSLPGPYGIGEIGHNAVLFLEWLAKAGFKTWQVLPLGPTGYGDSPYQCFSGVAVNPYLISVETLMFEKLLTKSDVSGAPKFSPKAVDYGTFIPWKWTVLRKAYETFKAGKFDDLRHAFEAYKNHPLQAFWLQDYCLFVALKDAHNGRPWWEWSAPLRQCDPAAIAAAKKQHADTIQFHAFLQFLFERQWNHLRNVARGMGIQIIGDLPIYNAMDSSDTWANQHLFDLRADGQPNHVAGVPPDYLSPTGQLWGNPLYRWEKLHEQDYKLWVDRLRVGFSRADIIRLDHFRGFEAFWQVPGQDKTAERGKWVKGPGDAFFQAMERHLGKPLPLIGENLGLITQEVEDLRHRYGLPGMRILQFAWGPAKGLPLRPDAGNPHLPFTSPKDDVIYTGTHDNPTTADWVDNHASAEEKALIAAYYRQKSINGKKATDLMMQSALESPADLVAFPMQDLLFVGKEGRMNTPGIAAGNWSWRVEQKAFTEKLAEAWKQRLALVAR